MTSGLTKINKGTPWKQDTKRVKTRGLYMQEKDFMDDSSAMKSFL